jgi:Xaa-Pro aminopeptidase
MKLENPLQIKPFKTRRGRLARSLGEGVVVLPTAPEHHRNADTHNDYRWDSGFFYLSGFRSPKPFW